MIAGNSRGNEASMDMRDAFETWLTSLAAWAENLLLPSRLAQLGILLACLALAVGVRLWLTPKMNAWLRSLEGRPKWQLRVLVVLRNRIQLIAFMALSWLAAGVMAEISPFPSRRYLLVLAATIATAWLAVGIAARLVRNTLARKVVTYGLWTYIALYYLGLLDDVTVLLGSLAIEFGDFRLSALAVLKGIVVTSVLLWAAGVASRAARHRIEAAPDLSPSVRVLGIKLLQVLLYGSAVFIGLKAVGFDLTALAVLSGAIGVGLGFGLQKVVSNLVSGLIIVMDRSIKPGDVISLGDTFGWINALGARYVSVVTRDGKEYLIPNEDLITGQVVNWSHSDDFVRLDIHFGTSYADDPHKVRALAVEAALGVPRVLHSKPPVCHVVGFGDSSVDYILRFWIRDPTQGLTNIRGDVFLALWDAFKANGITIPFPQREVRILGDASS